MPNSPDIRWKQRFENFRAAFSQLEHAVSLSAKQQLTDLEKQGLIQAFEFTHELAWNVLKDYFQYQGDASLITGSRDATREGFAKGLLKNGATWMEMIQSRNQTSHTYNQKIADEIVALISKSYYQEFKNFLGKMAELSKQ